MAIIEIDQSGKWEENRQTAIGAGIRGKTITTTSIISLDGKKAVMGTLGKFDQEKNRSKKKLIIRMFTYSVFLTIKDLVREDDVIFIDEEYYGNEMAIRDLLIYLFSRINGMKIAPKNIQFGLVGKESVCHKVAYQTFKGERDPDRRLGFEDFYKLVDRTPEIRKKAFDKRMKRNRNG